MIHHSRPLPKKHVHMMPTNPKPTLPMQQVPVFRVHYTALEKYIQQVFGFEFDFLMAANVREGIGVDYVVRGKLPATIAWERKIADLRRGQRTKEVVLILEVLAADGYIPKGQYTIATQKLPDPVEVYSSILRKTGNPQAPECLAMKAAQKGNKTFESRAAILDKAFAEAKE